MNLMMIKYKAWLVVALPYTFIWIKEYKIKSNVNEHLQAPDTSNKKISTRILSNTS